MDRSPPWRAEGGFRLRDGPQAQLFSELRRRSISVGAALGGPPSPGFISCRASAGFASALPDPAANGGQEVRGGRRGTASRRGFAVPASPSVSSCGKSIRGTVKRSGFRLSGPVARRGVKRRPYVGGFGVTRAGRGPPGLEWVAVIGTVLDLPKPRGGGPSTVLGDVSALSSGRKSEFVSGFCPTSGLSPPEPTSPFGLRRSRGGVPFGHTISA